VDKDRLTARAEVAADSVTMFKDRRNVTIFMDMDI
jgi:hypothetical protein